MGSSQESRESWCVQTTWGSQWQKGEYTEEIRAPLQHEELDVGLDKVRNPQAISEDAERNRSQSSGDIRGFSRRCD